MKVSKTILLFSISFISSASFGQKSESTSNPQGKHHVKAKPFISAGVNAASFYSEAFSKFIFENDGESKPTDASPNSDATIDSPGKLNFAQLKMHLDPTSFGPSLAIGLQLNSDKISKVKFYHVFQLSYSNFSGSYNGACSYQESGYVVFGGYIANVKDVSKTSYTQSTLSFGYKLEPTFKHFFLSFGINFSLNSVKINSLRNSDINGNGSDDAGPFSYSRTATLDLKNKFLYVNAPAQLGIGTFFTIKKIILKPAFYLAPYLNTEYNLYTLSLRVLFIDKKQ